MFDESTLVVGRFIEIVPTSLKFNGVIPPTDDKSLPLPFIHFCRITLSPLNPINRIRKRRPSPRRDGVSRLKFGADDETRTRDPHLGKVMRYQLRYIRKRKPQARFPWGTSKRFGYSRVRDTGLEPVTPTVSR